MIQPEEFKPRLSTVVKAIERASEALIMYPESEEAKIELKRLSIELSELAGKVAQQVYSL